MNLTKPLLLAGAIVPFLLAGGIAGTPAFAAPSPSQHSHPNTVVFSNPHMHLATPAAHPAPGAHTASLAVTAKTSAPAPANAAEPRTHSISHNVVRLAGHSWTDHRDARRYIVLHRGLSTLHGVVRTNAGKPGSHVRVALQRPGGRPFANSARKHITYTSATGAFTMTDVRPGKYRVFAFEGKQRKGHASKIIRPGSNETVAIRV